MGLLSLPFYLRKGKRRDERKREQQRERQGETPAEGQQMVREGEGERGSDCRRQKETVKDRRGERYSPGRHRRGIGGSAASYRTANPRGSHGRYLQPTSARSPEPRLRNSVPACAAFRLIAEVRGQGQRGGHLAFKVQEPIIKPRRNGRRGGRQRTAPGCNAATAAALILQRPPPRPLSWTSARLTHSPK